jgi:hypothetical protein
VVSNCFWKQVFVHKLSHGPKQLTLCFKTFVGRKKSLLTFKTLHLAKQVKFNDFHAQSPRLEMAQIVTKTALNRNIRRHVQESFMTTSLWWCDPTLGSLCFVFWQKCVDTIYSRMAKLKLVFRTRLILFTTKTSVKTESLKTSHFELSSPCE